MNIHERRAGRKRREREITLCHRADSVRFRRTMRLVAGETDMTVFRVDRRKGVLHVTVPVWA